MRKIICLLLALVIIFAAAGVCYAETATDKTENIPDNTLPGGQTTTVPEIVYNRTGGPIDGETVTIDSTEIPAGSSTTSVDTIEIDEQVIPQASSLPNTGGIPAEVFYAAGGLFIVAALILSGRKAAPKN